MCVCVCVCVCVCCVVLCVLCCVVVAVVVVVVVSVLCVSLPLYKGNSSTQNVHCFTLTGISIQFNRRCASSMCHHYQGGSEAVITDSPPCMIITKAGVE